MKDMELKVEELEVMEEMMSDFERGFWDGITYVAAAATLLTLT